MYGYPNTMIPPPWMWPQGPQSPSTPPMNPAEQITNWIKSLEELKKVMKEGDKKPDDKKDNKPKGNPQVVLMALFMLLIAPITGPAMYHFFQLSLSMVGK